MKKSIILPFASSPASSHTDNHVDILHRLAAAAQAARDFQTLDLRQRCQRLPDALGLNLDDGIEIAVGVLREEGDALQNFLLRLLAKAGQRRDLVVFRRRSNSAMLVTCNWS